MSRPVPQGGGNEEVLPEGSVVTISCDKVEGPFASKLPPNPKTGRPANDFFKLFFTVIGGDFEGYEFSDTAPNYVGQTNKTAQVFLAFMNLETLDGYEADWDDLIGKRCRAVTGVKETQQGGMFTKVEKYMRIIPRSKPQTAAGKYTPPADEPLDDVPF